MRGRPIKHAVSVGQRFSRLQIIGSVKNRYRAVLCQCDCGIQTVILVSDLISGHTTSCGCFRREHVKATKTTHGHTRDYAVSSEYRTWASMIQRCENPKVWNFKRYGGRGIAVCVRWRHDFSAFLADVGRKPSPRHSLDRFPNNDGNYEPGNVRWATIEEQALNRRPSSKWGT